MIGPYFEPLSEEVIKDMREAMFKADENNKLGEKIASILPKMGLDLFAATVDMTSKDRAVFRSCVALLVMNAKDPATVTAVTLLLHDYLLPTYEKKKALEQMIQSLNNAGITAPSK